MSNIKTAISLQESLFHKIEQVAAELNVTRSRLFALAVEKFIRDYENQKTLARLNEVYADGLDEEDERLLASMRRYAPKVVEKEEW